ncbi:MAG: PAS domain S-box protein [Ramlibacter sp.]|uniref:sensor histidine kinase n=1 Tax=Ramlibacter sp. TaxID=1917967 RepID=UPI002627C3F7|nr:PAS domain S-box protein [Ramlibacter sp.]MDH4377282.1 PAS domain S-box protein [Ramlibacter sp.]
MLPPFLPSADAASRLTALLDSAMDAIVSIDEAGRIVMYNRAAEQTFGWSASEMLGQPLERLMPERFRAGHASHVRQFASTGVTARLKGSKGGGEGVVLWGRRADGSEFPMDASISQIDTGHGKLFSVIIRDVTDRVKARQDLARFATEAAAIREQEKSRVARELHDELAQSLTALKMDAVWVRQHLAAAGTPSPALSAKIEGMLALLDDSVAATRRIAADLRPLVLDDLGLAPAIEWLVQSFSQRHGVPCHLDIDESLALGEPHATAVFRIVQESLNNVAKHAHAHQAWVRVVREAGDCGAPASGVPVDCIVLQVRDDGVGFDQAAARQPQSLGLIGLRERAQLLEGQVRIDSVPGAGTTVEARLPLPIEPVPAPGVRP